MSLARTFYPSDLMSSVRTWLCTQAMNALEEQMTHGIYIYVERQRETTERERERENLI